MRDQRVGYLTAKIDLDECPDAMAAFGDLGKPGVAEKCKNLWLRRIHLTAEIS